MFRSLSSTSAVRAAAGLALAVSASTPTFADLSADNGHCHLGRWVPDDLVAFAEVGTSMAFDGQTAVIGAPGQEAVFVYERQGSTWHEVQVIETEASPHASFGASVGFFGSYLIVGAPFDDTNGLSSGSAYLYENIGSTWTLIDSFHGTPASRFGSAVDVDDTSVLRVAVGAPGNNGSVRVYEEFGGGWISHFLSTPGTDEFGSALDLDYQTLVIGDWSDDTMGINMGAVHVYIITPAFPLYVEKIMPSDGNGLDNFGRSLAVDDMNRLVVGSEGNDEAGSDAGAAYVYDFTDTPFYDFHNETKILPCDPVLNGNFGSSVDLDLNGNRIAIGGRNQANDDGLNTGSVHIYRPNFFFSWIWDLDDTVTPEDGLGWDRFGDTVRISGDQVLVASTGVDEGVANCGAAYLVSLTRNTWGGGQCPCDILATATAYGTGKPGTLGTPVLSVNRPPVPGEASLFALSNALAGTQPFIIWGNIPAAIPFDGGELYMADPNFEYMPIVGALNQVGVQWVLPNNPALCGSDVYFQAMFIDPGAGGQFHTAQSNGLHTVVGY